MKSIWARNLTKEYWFFEREAGLAKATRALFSGKRVCVEAVRGINLEVNPGELIGFIGPNGAGKTTTLKMFSGILHPTGGEVEVLGFTPLKREKKFLKKISFISGQRNRLFWDLPAEDYFQFIRTMYEIPREVFLKNRKELVEMAEIGDLLHAPQRKLSFGQRKRCELVAGLLHDPQMIFLDEPTNALDLINARKIREFIKKSGKEKKPTVILTSHHMADIEQVCERVIIMNAGKIVFDGPIRDLSRLDRAKREVRILFHGSWDFERLKEMGNIKEAEGQQVVLEVEADKTADISSVLLSSFPVRDVTITGTPLETIIESFYLAEGSKPGAKE